MYQKINAKNLTYSQNLPPFLAALRDQVSGQTGPDPILAARRRPVKKRSASEEAEDAPLVLDEHGDVIVGVTVGVDGTAAMPAGPSGKGQRQILDDRQERQEGNTGEDVAGARTEKKRKVGKVVGGEDEGEEVEAHAYGQRKREKNTTEREFEKKTVSNAKDKAVGDRGAAKERKNKKKSKKMKMRLSFEDDDVAA
ncbi:hypothetical protein CMQ_4916 [Grosmannia clavigera kw1407]|uniref:DUF4604 domain-containing protein n=1 Tax=Grosmannia clavigera (strain kw1407 / UAMH 11150) TaxID=655863 RepID=F0XBW2_GROCL|nr:uncharacterized protein CMQ_4916 [Grosmannia clavigera kw1407]EFX04829.1 hypothetical protein CMQ_4916 [Grosmannia clavigera kw1407]